MYRLSFIAVFGDEGVAFMAFFFFSNGMAWRLWAGWGYIGHAYAHARRAFEHESFA